MKKILRIFLLFTLSVLAYIVCISTTVSAAKPEKYMQVDSFSLGNGKKVYVANCAGCHGTAGEGSYGPNLCDNYWLHGSHYHNIVHVIKHGVSAKGMTAFHHTLKHPQIRDVAHYVMSLKGTNPKNAKAPQGKLHK